ncbi:hypothetical protein [Alkalimarinus coralli]|uniref:hypothetical protein n=1 Tax=Alkalimarinus coralli TaxID=2935863 RepID=UPI00202B2C85|nr:hypothetical protein [Alkalimarinus coralli]
MSLKGFWRLGGSCFTLLFAILCTSSVQASEGTPEDLTWKSLKYAGSKFFISLDTEVNVEMISKEQAKGELITPKEGEGKAPISDKIVKINVKNSVVGSDTDFTVWMEPDTTVLQRTSIYGGIKKWYRTYRFMTDKVYSDKRKPANGDEKDQPWSAWTDIAQGFFKLDDTEQKATISESEALFYLIGTAGLKKTGDSAELNMYDRGGVIKAVVNVIGAKRVFVDYRINKDGETTRVRKKVVALEAVVDAKSIKEGGNLEKFKFLGYKDDVRLLIDPKLNAILEISGAVEYVGDVTIRLENITLN